MGSYDNVNFKAPCVKCGEILDEFQTKDLGCNFETVEYWECVNFYDYCDKCKFRNEYNLAERKPFIPIAYYKVNEVE